MRLTRLPKRISNYLYDTRPFFRDCHHLVFCWLLTLQLCFREKANLKELSRIAPSHTPYWRLRRFLLASYWYSRALLHFFVINGTTAFPPPKDGTLYVIVDASAKGKRGRRILLPRKDVSTRRVPICLGFTSLSS